jgi:hypothetical protein
MVDFTFKAPTLFDAAATADESGTVYHDAPGTGEMLAKRKRFAHWLKGEMVGQGLDAQGPTDDEGGWIITVPAVKRRFGFGAAKQTGFVLVMVSIERFKDDILHVLTGPIGSAQEQNDRVERVVEKILRESDSVSDLSIDR